VLVHLGPSVGFLSGTKLPGVNIDIGTVEENIGELVSKDDPEVSGKDPSSFNLVLSVVLDIGKWGLGFTSLLRFKSMRVEVDVGVRVGTLGLDISVGSPLFGGSSSRGRNGIGSTLDSVVGNSVESVGSIGRSLSRPKHGTEEEVVPLEGVVLLDDLAVDVWQPKEDGKDGDNETSEDNGKSDSDFRKFVKVEVGCTLVHYWSANGD
jgi:hypothetical protein